MPNLELHESVFDCEIVSTNVISVLGLELPEFLRAMHMLRSAFDPESLEVSGSGVLYQYELLLADSRFYRAELNTSLGTRAIESSPFTLRELLAHNPVIELVFALLAKSATSIEVNWT